MPQRISVAQELAKLLNVLSHPDRVRIVGELRTGERDVNTLRKALGLTQARVSQQLALMRANRMVRIRRQGRHIFYSLSQPGLAEWLVEGLRFVEGEAELSAQLQAALGQARDLWSATWDENPTTEEPTIPVNGTAALAESA
jgi:DNA-binding transcriptional ArsR family regulator